MLLRNIRFKQYYDQIIKIDFLTKFNIINNLCQANINQIILNFSFKSILFNKKKIIYFLMALELITGQKSMLTRSRKPFILFKLRKDSIVGCKVNLRKKNLYYFYDYILLALPKSENFKGFLKQKIEISNKNTFSSILEDLFTFYQLDLIWLPMVQSLDMTFVFNTYNKDEKIFLLSSYKLPIKKN